MDKDHEDVLIMLTQYIILNGSLLTYTVLKKIQRCYKSSIIPIYTTPA